MQLYALPQHTLVCGHRQLDLGSPQVMGILNVTPDSFSDGGRYTSIDAALAQATPMTREGAVILEVWEALAEKKEEVEGYQRVRSPQIAKEVVPMVAHGMPPPSGAVVPAELRSSSIVHARVDGAPPARANRTCRPNQSTIS